MFLGLVVEVFVFGVVLMGCYELFSVFIFDMKEFYFVRYDEEDKFSMIVYEYNNNCWEKIVIGLRVGEFVILFDGKIMYFGR